MANSQHLEKSKNCYISATNLMKYGMVVYIGPLDPSANKISRF